MTADAEPSAPETTLFSAPSEYAAAIERVLPLAKRQIIVFDLDLAQGDWGTTGRTETLRRFLLAEPRSRLQIVVHDTHHIERSLPRLLQLLRDFSHKLEILRTGEDGHDASDAFVVVDDRHLVHRYHTDWTRGELSLDNPEKARALHGRYGEILAHAESGVNATQLGL